jgi:hypothetical protein
MSVSRIHDFPHAGDGKTAMITHFGASDARSIT